MKITDTSERIELPRPPVSENSKEALAEYGDMVVADYRDFKRNFMEWLITEGKSPYRGEGYSDSTVEHTHYKVDEAYRWKWNQTGEYTTEFTPEEATTLIDFMMKRTEHPDRYIYGFEKSIRRLFKYFREELNRDIEEWEHDIPVEPSRGSADHVKDRFYPEEMNKLYETALNKYSVKSYYNKNMTGAERDALKATISQRLGIPKSEVGPEEFKEASSWKVPSIIAVSADCGLRPIEVGRAKMDWFDLDNQLMLVPLEDSTKNEDNWECWLSNKTVNALEHWIEERNSYEKYQGRDELWLTQQANRYKARPLNKMLDKLMEEAEIEATNRKLSWYSFRHGAATLWAEQEDIYRAKEQLRHKSIETTLQYTRGGSNKNRRAESTW